MFLLSLLFFSLFLFVSASLSLCFISLLILALSLSFPCFPVSSFITTSLNLSKTAPNKPLACLISWAPKRFYCMQLLFLHELHGRVCLPAVFAVVVVGLVGVTPEWGSMEAAHFQLTPVKVSSPANQIWPFTLPSTGQRGLLATCSHRCDLRDMCHLLVLFPVPTLRSHSFILP